jgi:hypothetical protein
VTSQSRPNFRLARPLIIREANTSFALTQHTISTTMKKCESLKELLLQLSVTSRRVLGLCLGIYWLSGVLLFLVKE